MLTVDDIKDRVCETVADYPNVKRVDLFGSYAQHRQTGKSDIDLLVEFTSIAVSLLTLSRLRAQLEEKLQTSVDLVHAPLPEGSFLDIGETVTLYER